MFEVVGFRTCQRTVTDGHEQSFSQAFAGYPGGTHELVLASVGLSTKRSPIHIEEAVQNVGSRVRANKTAQ